MGNKIEIWGFIYNPNPELPGLGYKKEYYFVEVWRGESLLKTLWYAFRARKTYEMIKIEWRP